MQAMIQNDEQKGWMQPILDYRNRFLAVDDRPLRDFRRMNGNLTVFKGGLVHGPYKQSYRAELLKELLQTQKLVQEAARSQGGESIELISVGELDEIRRIWVEDKREIDDLVPGIYEQVYGRAYPGGELEPIPLDRTDLGLLRQVTEELDADASEELYKLTRSLLGAQFKTMQTQKRSKHLDELESILQFHAFRNEAEALEFALSSDQRATASTEIEILDSELAAPDADPE
jgi:hypothetical protein